MSTDKTLKETLNSALRKTDVMRRWKFFYDGEEDDWTFEIEAKDYEEAFNKAYETHGPQVESMLYEEVLKREADGDKVLEKVGTDYTPIKK